MSGNTQLPFMAQNFPPRIRFFTLLLTFGAIFWLGSITARAIVANEFFIPTTLEFDPSVSLDTERTLFQLVSALSTVVLISYAVVLVSALYLVFNIPLKRREHGWLLAASILFFLFVPVELFTAWLDLKFIFLWLETKGIIGVMGIQVYAQHSTHLRETLSHRIGALSGLPVIALFCYFSAIFFVVWQPMKRPPLAEAEAHPSAAGREEAA